MLVPGDIINIKLRDIVPAHARLLEGDPLNIDQVLIQSFSLLLISDYKCWNFWYAFIWFLGLTSTVLVLFLSHVL